jgi:hypothetical protein
MTELATAATTPDRDGRQVMGMSELASESFGSVTAATTRDRDRRQVMA